MEFSKVIRERYSCRSFDSKRIEREKLAEILEAGRLAPTAKNLQEQHIYVVESKEGLEKIDRITPCRYNALTVLVVCYDRNNVFVYPGEKRDSGTEDATVVAAHMMLAAKDEGIESCWINFFDPQKAKEELSLPENEEAVMILDLGYAKEETKPLPTHSKRKDISETVSYL